MSTAHDLLLAKSAEIGWPIHYRGDLENHDRRLLELTSPSAFVWLVRTTGTWTLLPDDPHAYQILDYCLRRDRKHRAFRYCNGALHEIRLDSAWKFLYDRASDTIREFADLRNRDSQEFNSMTTAVRIGRVAMPEIYGEPVGVI